ncbi:hypothetical protein SAMN02927924_01451 [Sphingobium faniae]|nr:hypothetical protein SAMN02927924_01451 [Sphingobium faniae]
MKIIMHCDLEEAQDLLKVMLDSREQFARHPERIGWGWHFSVPNRRSFFIRQIKGGLSASPTDKD